MLMKPMEEGRKGRKEEEPSPKSSANYFSSDQLANRSVRRRTLTIITLDDSQVCI